MRISKVFLTALLMAVMVIGACADGDDKPNDNGGSGGNNSGGSSCNALCKVFEFSAGVNEDFPEDNVYECTCSGSGNDITQDACTSHCSQYDIAADGSFLSTHNNVVNKCVCDGTGE